MSGYLNLGISFIRIPEFPKAEDAFIAGLQFARKREDRGFEGSFLAIIGNVYFNQRRLEEALNQYTEARTIFLEIGANLQLRIVEENIEQLRSETEQFR